MIVRWAAARDERDAWRADVEQEGLTPRTGAGTAIHDTMARPATTARRGLLVVLGTLAGMLGVALAFFPARAAPHGPPQSSCSLWSDATFTCNIFNPSERVASVSATVEVDCSKAVNGKRDYADSAYHETLVALDIPEQGWRTLEEKPAAFRRFYSTVERRLEQESQALSDVAKEGGLRAGDLTDTQRKFMERTPLDACVMRTTRVRYTELASSPPASSLLAALSDLLRTHGAGR